jgi:hypothetical protein
MEIHLQRDEEEQQAVGGQDPRATRSSPRPVHTRAAKRVDELTKL